MDAKSLFQQTESDKTGRPSFCTYLLTIRRVCFDRAETQEFRDYFDLLAQSGCEVLVVDGSPAEVFEQHAKVWRGVCRHETVDLRYKFLNGKVNGIHTGIEIAAHESVVLADDDIRYTAEDIKRTARLLETHDMVRPQNYPKPLPVWARTEAARMLINRAWLPEGDYTGTLGVRRSAMLKFGHYDGDVLFDNEEIVRYFRLHKAKIAYARDLFVLKKPPTFRKWIEQRPRQAYEDFVMRAKTAFFVSLPPAFALLWTFAGYGYALGFCLFVACGSIILASRGLGDGATKFFHASLCLYAPLWIAERALSTYWAFYWRIVHGGYPFGAKLLTKGTGHAWTTGGRTPLSR